jgi:uncharacterized protein GlcG (DUF336 family)
VIVAVALAASLSCASAQDAVVTFKSIAPDTARQLAQAALETCRTSGYQVAVAVVDRFGTPLVMLRDRFAGPHTPSTASGKAWTALSFRTSTQELATLTQQGQPQSGLRQLPNVVAIGGGLIIEGGGAILGGVGVSGAPGGPEDERCARAGIEAVRDGIEF